AASQRDHYMTLVEVPVRFGNGIAAPCSSIHPKSSEQDRGETSRRHTIWLRDSARLAAALPFRTAIALLAIAVAADAQTRPMTFLDMQQMRSAPVTIARR